jgi:ABC-type lipoprotein release transport system permease subunit
VLASVLVIVISTLASVQPAVRASRMEPIDALRHV